MSYTGLVELKPCPCCSSDAHLTPMNTGHTVRFYVHCEHCGLRTPHYAVETDAIAAWNTRPDAIEALTRPVDVEAIVDAALDAANVVTLDGYFEYDREAALAAALAAMEAPHADG